MMKNNETAAMIIPEKSSNYISHYPEFTPKGTLMNSVFRGFDLVYATLYFPCYIPSYSLVLSKCIEYVLISGFLMCIFLVIFYFQSCVEISYVTHVRHGNCLPLIYF